MFGSIMNKFFKKCNCFSKDLYRDWRIVPIVFTKEKVFSFF